MLSGSEVRRRAGNQLKWRAYYAQKIREFREQNPDQESQRLAANVLSFLIHNGVLVQV